MIFDGKKKKLLGAYAGKDGNGDYLFILSSNDSSNRCRLTPSAVRRVFLFLPIPAHSSSCN